MSGTQIRKNQIEGSPFDSVTGHKHTGAEGDAPAINGGASTLDDLTDVNASSPNDNQVLSWDTATSKWIASDLPTEPTHTLDNLTDVVITTPSDGAVLTWDNNSSSWIDAAIPAVSTNIKTAAIGITIDGNGSAITTGIKGYRRVPFDCTIVSWDILADASGAVKIDVWKDTYANYPPTNADSICNGHEPEIAASGTKAEDTSLGDWASVAVAAGDVLVFNVDSCVTITNLTLTLKVTKS